MVRSTFRCSLLLVMALAGCATHRLGGSYREMRSRLAASDPAPAPTPDAADVFAGHAVLDRDALVAEVLRRNPTVEAARQAWRAALARYPQAVSLDDPTLGYGVAPASFGSSAVDPGYRVDVSQELPFPGKRALRGLAALAEADAAANAHEAARVRIGTMAALLSDEYYFLTRSLEINSSHMGLVEELKRVAVARYESGQGTQHDPIQAEVELAHLDHDRIQIATAKRVTAEQINVLLHRDPVLPVPPAPARLTPAVAPIAETREVLARALEEHPKLRAADARIAAREAEVRLARREFLPNFAVMGAYDAVWQEDELKPFVGASVNVPLRLARRRAAVEEAEANLARARSEQASARDQIRFGVEIAGERLHEAGHVLALYRERLLPAARDQVRAARAAFETGRTSFLAVIEAERNLRTAELGAEQALTDLSRRLTELEAATGRVVVGGAGGPDPADTAARHGEDP